MGMSSNVCINLKKFGLNVVHLHNGNGIEKHRIIDSRFNHHLLRYDVGEETLLEEIDIKKIKKQKNIDAIVISDYDKGFLRYNSIVEICENFKGLPIFVDTKKQNLTCFKDCVIKINEKEFKEVKKFPKDCKMIVTLGDKGALYEDVVYPTTKTEVFDVCGAGDVFLSGLVYGFLKHRDIPSAIQLANKCATAREMLSRVTLALENLPFFLQPGCRVLNKGSLE